MEAMLAQATGGHQGGGRGPASRPQSAASAVARKRRGRTGPQHGDEEEEEARMRNKLGVPQPLFKKVMLYKTSASALAELEQRVADIQQERKVGGKAGRLRPQSAPASGRPRSISPPSRGEQEQKAHAVEVAQRRLARKQEEMDRKQGQLEKWDRYKAQQAAADHQQQLFREREQRTEQWAMLVALLGRVQHLRAGLQAERRVRPMQQLRKQAAVRIASWYKSILVRRGARALKRLILRLRDLVHDHIVQRCRVRARRRCAERLVHFLHTHNEANLAILAMRRFKSRVVLLQRAWRGYLLICKAQASILAAYFLQFEARVIKANRKAARRVATTIPLDRWGSCVLPQASSLMPQMSVGGLLLGMKSLGPQAQKQLESLKSGMIMSAPSIRPLRQPSSAIPRLSSVMPPPRPPLAPPPLGPAASRRISASEIAAAYRVSSSGAAEGAARLRQQSVVMAGQQQGAAGGAMHYVREDHVLAHHFMPLPADVRQQLLENALKQERKDFRRVLEAYEAEKRTYQMQRPIEEARVRLLRDAGLPVVSTLAPPPVPRLRVLLPEPKMALLLRSGIQVARAAAQEALEAAGSSSGGKILPRRGSVLHQ